MPRLDGTVQAVLRRQRQKKASEEKSNGLNPSESVASFPHDSVFTDISAEHGAPSLVRLSPDSDSPHVDKECFIERLVLEEVISSIFTRCMLFVTSFLCLIIMMWLSFPASAFYPVHQSIINGFDLAGSFESISTLEDVQSYLTKAASMSRAFSPVSSTYLDDIQSKSFIDAPQTFPPIKQLGPAQFPTLTAAFTITAWVKTRVRLDTIIKKQVGNLTCWSMGPEAVIFGEHDSYQLETVVHPWAKSIYLPGVERTNAWKSSDIHRKVSDNKWHHLGFRVSKSMIDFVYDGRVEGSSPLSWPVTDCPGGNVIIGSDRFVAEMSDLVYFNRILNDLELEETYATGRPIDVLLSGSGPKASTEEFTLQQQLAELDASTTRRLHDMEDKVHLGQRSVVLEMLKRFPITTTDTTDETGSITTTTTIRAAIDAPTELRSAASLYFEGEQSCRTRTLRDTINVLHDPSSLDTLKAIFESDTRFKSNHDILVSQFLPRFADCVQNEVSPPESTVFFMKMTDDDFIEYLRACRQMDSNFTDTLIKAYDRDFFNQFSEIFVHFFRNSLLLVEQDNCRLYTAYRDECRATCGLPSIPSSTEPSRESRDHCIDTNVYRDSWDRDCAWYQLNDKECERYASDETRKHCQKTCGPHAINQNELLTGVLNENDKERDFLNVEELNMLLLRANQDHMLISRNVARNYVAYYCCLRKHHSNEPDDASWKKYYGNGMNLKCDVLKPSWHNRYVGNNLDDGLHPDIYKAFQADYKLCFPNKPDAQNPLANIGFPTEWLTGNGADNIIAHIFKDAIFGTAPQEEPRIVIKSAMSPDFPNRTRTANTKVQLFAGSTVLDDTFSLTTETHEWRWKECTEHSECTGLAFACQPDHYVSGLCKKLQDNGLPPQKQFCSLTCFTGGCDRENNVCQPCDACVGDDCTDACGVIIETVLFDAVAAEISLQDYYQNVGIWKKTDVHTNTYSISAWVKDFGFQHLFEKRVNVTLPPAYENSEAYDATTKSLTCYWISYSEFCFRTHWYDKTMTCIPNPLSSLLQDDKWHHFVVVKSAVEMELEHDVTNDPKLKKRVDDFKFFVDGKQSGSVQFDTATGDKYTSMHPYAASDCGGPMVTTVEITHARDDTTLGKDTEKFSHYMRKAIAMDYSHFLPFGNHSVVLRFEGLGVPRNAVIKQAYLEFSAVQNPVQHAIEDNNCGTQTRNSVDFLGLEIISLSGDLLQKPCASITTKTACDQTSCYWDAVKNSCIGGVSCPEYWRKNNHVRWAEVNGKHLASVPWDVDVEEWRKTNLRIATRNNGAHESVPYDVGTQSGAVRISPDVRTLIEGILARPEYDPKNTTATFMIRKPQINDGNTNDICFGTLNYTNAFGEDNTCSSLQSLGSFIDDNFPFLALSKEGASQAKSGSAPRLRIYWCYTDDCISPTFAGAGDDVKWGRRGFVASSDHSSLTASQRDKYPTNRPDDVAATPTYNDIPYVVLGASTTHNQDPLSQGKMFDLRTMPRAMNLSEVQQMYYANVRTVPDLPGPEHLIDAQSDESQLDALEYTKEVVSIAPPVLLQTRNRVVSCASLVPALGTAMTDYFNLHIEKKCRDGPYTCKFPSMSGTAHSDRADAFSCVNRAQYVEDDRYFGREHVDFEESNYFFPEFLELMNLRTVYRDDKMLAAKNWVDLASSTIILVGVFLAPSERLGTVMQLKIENGGAGQVESSYSLSSFKQMSSTEQMLCIILACIVSVCCFIEMYFIISSWISRSRDKKKWMCLALACCKMRTEDIKIHFANMNALEQEEMDRKESRRFARRMKLITQNCPVINFWDAFDMALRFVILVLVVVYMITYYSPALYASNESDQIGAMEEYLKQILELEWHDQETNVKDKIQKFVNEIGNIVGAVNHLLRLRIFCALLILVCMFRLIVYMRVHPRVAILYKTVASSVDDLFHFALTFSFLYLALAFTATWTFGTVDERYATFGATCYSQFNMIIGEYPMDPVVELQSLYVAYLFVFCVVMFLIIMNFFLAILIDSYSAIKDQVNECRVAQNFLSDVYFTLAFPYHQWAHKWPSRWQLIDMLLRADVDGNNINDEEQSFAVSVAPQDLVEQEIIPDLDSATALITHYLDVSPDLAGAKKNNKNDTPVLEHHIVLKRLLQLDLVSHDLRGLHREVHPLGRRSEETKVLVKQLVRTGQKILSALRINKTQFRSDILLQDDGVTDGMMMGVNQRGVSMPSHSAY